jgi:hypothetical protein
VLGEVPGGLSRRFGPDFADRIGVQQQVTGKRDPVCGSARSRARADSPSSSRTSARITSQSSPVSVTWSGVISQVSRTLRSISVCSPRPNRAGRALAIIRLACGAVTGKLIGPAPATVSLTSLAGTDSCALNAPRAGEPASTLASRSLGVIGISVPSCQPRAVGQSGYRGIKTALIRLGLPAGRPTAPCTRVSMTTTGKCSLASGPEHRSHRPWDHQR